MRNQEIPHVVVERAKSRLREAGFKQRLNAQAIRMIEDVTEITNYLGGRIDWSEPQSAAQPDG